MTDEELVARLQANDDVAYRDVVVRYGDALYRYIFGIVGDQHMSEDVLSETYLRMVEKIDSYRYYGVPFKAWLYRIAHNQAITMLRRGQRTVGGDALEQAAPTVEDASAGVVAQFEAAALRSAMRELTADQQQVVLLRFIANQSTSEVAQALNKNENAIKQLQFRALRSLARLLDRQDF